MGMKEAMDGFGQDNQIQNRVKQTYELAMDGVITKENAISNLLLQYRKTGNLEIKEGIVRKIESINER